MNSEGNDSHVATDVQKLGNGHRLSEKDLTISDSKLLHSFPQYVKQDLFCL
jgi:hypothetical protein